MSLITTLSLKSMRFVSWAASKFLWLGKLPGPVEIENQVIPIAGEEIGVRIYRPLGDGPFAMVVFYHGGGFVSGDLETYDPLCRDLCVNTGQIILSIDYRLAPEHPFPCAPNDCMAALRWVLEHAGSLRGDKDKIFVAGDSAGGNLAAVTAIQARWKLPGLLKGQLLLYPVTDHYQHAAGSYIENATGQGLTRSMMIRFWDLYLGESSLLEKAAVEEMATPLRVQNLSDLPPTLLLTAEKDPLRDEGIRYAQLLAAQGVKVQHTLYKGVQHGFIGMMGPTAQHRRGIAEITAWFKQF